MLLGDYDVALEKLNGTFTEPAESVRPALARVVKRLTSMPARLRGELGEEHGETRWWDGLHVARRCAELLEQALEMSARNSNIMSEAQLEELWFGILRRTVRWQEQVAAAQGARTKRHAALALAFEELVAQAMRGLLTFLSLPRSLKWLCEEFGESRLGIWRAPVHSLLSGLHFQLGLLCAAKAVAAQDVVKPFSAVKVRGSRGVRLSPCDVTEASHSHDAEGDPGDGGAVAAVAFLPSDDGGQFKVRLAGAGQCAARLAERLAAPAARRP